MKTLIDFIEGCLSLAKEYNSCTIKQNLHAQAFGAVAYFCEATRGSDLQAASWSYD